jgi:colanic acid biosynthesis glycosyl transferase WcaI
MAEGLAASGHDMSVITTMPHYPEWRFRQGYEGWTRRESLNGVRVTRVRHRLPGTPVGIDRLLSELSFGIRALFSASWKKSDVVVFVTPALFAIPLALVRLRLQRSRPTTILWVQDLYGEGMVQASGRARRSLMSRVVMRVEAAVFQRVDRVVTIHQRFAERIDQFTNGSVETTVLRNWSHRPPAARVDRDAARAMLGWDRDEVIVLHAGNMGVKQDLDNVLAAARLVDVESSPLRFVLMGDGSQRSRLEALGSDVPSLRFVAPLGDDLFALALQAADVLLVNEAVGVQDMALPSKLTSYFTSGRPIVAATSATSVTAAELRAASAGVQVPPGDPSALILAVTGLARDTATSGILGRNGLAYAAEHLTADAALGRFLSILAALPSRPGDKSQTRRQRDALSCSESKELRSEV